MRHSLKNSNPSSSDIVPQDRRSHADSRIPFAERLTCSIAEACDATGLGRTKLYELIGRGTVATSTVGRRRLILVQSLRALVHSDQ